MLDKNYWEKFKKSFSEKEKQFFSIKMSQNSFKLH